MAAEIEWIVGIVRAGEDFENHGDPYEFSCTVNLRGEEAELIGGCGEITPTIWREIKQALLAKGITRAQWRRVNGVARNLVVDSNDNFCVTLEPGSMPVEGRASN